MQIPYKPYMWPHPYEVLSHRLCLQSVSVNGSSQAWRRTNKPARHVIPNYRSQQRTKYTKNTGRWCHILSSIWYSDSTFLAANKGTICNYLLSVYRLFIFASVFHNAFEVRHLGLSCVTKIALKYDASFESNSYSPVEVLLYLKFNSFYWFWKIKFYNMNHKIMKELRPHACWNILQLGCGLQSFGVTNQLLPAKLSPKIEELGVLYLQTILNCVCCRRTKCLFECIWGVCTERSYDDYWKPLFCRDQFCKWATPGQWFIVHYTTYAPPFQPPFFRSLKNLYSFELSTPIF